MVIAPSRLIQTLICYFAFMMDQAVRVGLMVPSYSCLLVQVRQEEENSRDGPAARVLLPARGLAW